MQKWEYLFILALENGVFECNGEPLNKGKLGIKLCIPLQPYLDTLGNEGWELVGICPATEGALQWRLVFKRPKDE